jgi:nicotinate-nucleotide pyrophosphorylase (carboxylating)
MSLKTTLQPLIQLALQEDFADSGDVTSQAIIPMQNTICASITAKASGVIAVLEAVALVYQQIDPTVTVRTYVEDGAQVSAGTVVCEVEGATLSVLSGERTALNFLQRLSGVATLTRRYVDAVAGTGAVILDTRKTTPGWRELEKYAVRMGGGQNHRMGLFDMVMIKDNHIDAAGSITAAVAAVRQHPAAKSLQIEVEVKDETELQEALALNVDRIMLDNMTPQQMRRAVQITNGGTPLEASGNVNLETVRTIAETGVDFISVGALTHSAPILDLSMRIPQSEKTVTT